MTTRDRYFAIISMRFILVSTALAIDPYDRADWALENVLVFVGVIMLAGTYRKFPLSRVSYTLIFCFLCIHQIGAHYTYSNVPYDVWFKALTGTTFNELMGWERNQFDRLVHLLYGLLLAYPIREVFLRVAGVRGFWGYFLPLDLTMSTSMIYELIEWGAAEVFGGDLGVAYLGTQGDSWDAHKDMAIASLGALISMIITAALNIYLQRDFAREWVDSLRIKRPLPLGEESLARLLQQNDSDTHKDDDA
jgi:putative membrane protein